MIIVKGEGIQTKHVKARMETVIIMKDRQVRQNIRMIGILKIEKSTK